MWFFLVAQPQRGAPPPRPDVNAALNGGL